MEQKFISIPLIQYELLKKKAELADDAIIQLELSLEDMKHKRVSRF